MKCQHGGQRSGCPWIDVPYSTQLERKTFGSVSTIQGVGENHFRERLDVAVKDGKCGLYDVSHKEVVDHRECPVLTPELESWFLEFRKNPPQVKKGSVRLRVAPKGPRGIWLDLANLDIKALMQEGTYLRSLLEKSIVEIGQRHKRLGIVEGKLKLLDPELFAWSETYADDAVLPLYSTIGSFTQTGRKANRLLTSAVRDLFPTDFPKRWLEYGAGNGTFTLPLLKWGASVTAFEIDERSLLGLKTSTDTLGLSSTLTIHRKGLLEHLENSDVVLVDPPRSGIPGLLGDFVHLPKEQLPKYFVYVSCFRETFESDAKILTDSSYKISKLVGVDQFPHSPHCEYVALFTRSDAPSEK